MKELGAVFGSVYGWERPNWFAPQGYGLSEADLAKPDVLLNENHPPVGPGEKPREKWSFRRSNYFQFVGDECRNVHDNVGLMDMSAFAKCEVSGPGAESWLNSILTNRAPKTTGRVTLSYLLTERGGVRAEFTLTRIGPERFYLISAGALETHDFDVLEKLLPADNSVRLDKVTTQRGVLVLAGPALARGARQGRRHRRLEQGVPVAHRAAPVDQGRGRHRHAGQFRRRARLRIAPSDRDAERDLRRADGGGRAVWHQAVRHPRHGFAAGWKSPTSSSGANCRSNMPRSSRTSSGSSISTKVRFSAARRSSPGGTRASTNKLVTLEVQGVTDADARGSEPVMKNGAMIGRTTSGGYGWRTGKSLALAMVKPELSHIGGEVDVRILGETHRAVIIPDSPYDPANAALRA